MKGLKSDHVVEAKDLYFDEESDELTMIFELCEYGDIEKILVYTIKKKMLFPASIAKLILA